MSYDYAREIDDARLDDDWRDEAEADRWDAQQDAAEAERDDLLNGPCVGPYRCTDRMCGASDCSNCHPEGCAPEPEPEEEL